MRIATSNGMQQYIKPILESHFSSGTLYFELGDISPSSDVKFYIATFQKKKNMIGKTSFFSHKSPCLPLKIFKLMNKREERSNNVGKTVVIFPHIFRETLGALVHLSVLKRAFVSVKFVFFNFNINKRYNFFTNFIYGEKRSVIFFYNVPFLLKLDSF